MSHRTKCSNGHDLRIPGAVYIQKRKVGRTTKPYRLCKRCHKDPNAASQSWDAYRAECIRIDDEILGMVDRMDLASRVERDQMHARIAILRDRKDRMEAELVAARGKHGDAATGSE